jgi:sigma-E factor negative regulatory protein RseC
MGKKKTINHTGIIQNISSERILVQIMNLSACSGCHAKGACSMADVKEKIIEVHNPQSLEYIVGDKVNVICDEELGFIALFWAYICPLIIILVTLFVGSLFTESEMIYGLISCLILIPYYLTLRLFKDKLKKRFNFKIEK